MKNSLTFCTFVALLLTGCHKDADTTLSQEKDLVSTQANINNSFILRVLRVKL